MKFIMRVGFFYFFLALLSIQLLLAHSGRSQALDSIIVTVELRNDNLTSLFRKIEKQTGLLFAYQPQLVDGYDRITLPMRTRSVKATLDLVLEGTHLEYRQVNNNVIIFSEEEKRSVVTDDETLLMSITGTVTDSGGVPLPGVNVIVKGTTIGTSTDSNGKYLLEIFEKDPVLIFSFIGYLPQEVAVNNRSVVDISLAEDVRNLDEVVVIGYGTKKKENLTAAVEVVDMEGLKNRPVISVTEMLQGSIANLNIITASSAPGKTPGLNIRGFTGRNQSGEPLIIVDGVPYDIDLINPNDVASVTVLKDAAASAIYGSRAPNGVIIITTKSGGKNTGMTFSYSNVVRASTPLDLPSSLNAYDFALLNNEAGYNSQAAPEYPEETLQRIRAFMNGEITDNNIIENGKWGFAFTSNANEDYYDIAFKDVVVNHSHNFSLRGGGEKTTYYASVGYQKDQGVYNSDIDKYQTKNVTIRMDNEVNKWLKIGLNTRYTNHDNIRPNIMGGSDNDGNFMNNIAFRPNIPNINRVGEYEGINEFSVLPSLIGDGGSVNRLRHNFITSFNAEINPVDGLSIRGSYTLNLDNEQDQITTFVYAVTEPDGSTTRSRRSANQNVLEKWRNNTNYQTSDLVVTFSKIFGKHDFTVLGGYQQEVSDHDDLNARNTDFYTTSVPSFNAMYGENQVISDNLYSWATQGYFGRISYNYDGRYLIDFNSRYDATSMYSADSRWAFFPSVSVGYNIAKEKFWPLKAQVDMFKIKGSWGRLGNAGTGRPRYIAPLATGAQIDQVLGGARPAYVSMPGIVSEDLTWTKPRTIGLGLEVGALDNRLLFSYDWYQRTIFDEEGVAEQLPEVLGASPPARNNAISETRGWEVSAEWRDGAFELGGEQIEYSFRFILSDYVGYVVKYADNPAGLRNLWTPGQQFGKVYGYESAGIQTSPEGLKDHILYNTGWFYPGDLLFNDLDGDGRIGTGDGGYWYSEGDRTVLGYDYPRYKYSAVLSAGWKGLRLRVLLDGVGHEVLYANNKFTTGAIDIGSRGLLDYHGELGYWNMDNQDAFFPRLYRNTKNFNMANDQYKQDLAHLRIKNVNLSYNIPASIIHFGGIDRLAINLSVENAGMIFRKSWSPFDPQFLKSSTYPPSRIFAIGLNVDLK
jgi:TonB-linked SusC/RagA family outer membrane protein